MSKTPALFPPSLQSTSGSAQVGLLQQGVRLLRSPAVPQASSDVFTFPQSACSLEQNFAVEDVGTPKVGPILGKKKNRLKIQGHGCLLVVCLSLALIFAATSGFSVLNVVAMMVIISLRKYVLKNDPDKPESDSL